MSEGKIKKVDSKGFGFIRRADGSDIFFHCSDLVDGIEFNSLEESQQVRFQEIEGERGPKAINVEPV